MFDIVELIAARHDRDAGVVCAKVGFGYPFQVFNTDVENLLAKGFALASVAIKEFGVECLFGFTCR